MQEHIPKIDEIKIERKINKHDIEIMIGMVPREILKAKIILKSLN